MKIIYNTCLDPYFNLASEEYFLENCSEDCFMVWRNAKSVIIGKNQNVYSEVNIPFCSENGIRIVRRLTGGGAVFHDPGNVNFTFITDAKEGGDIDFLSYITPVCKALSAFGINAYPNGRNDIEACGFKISGNAQCRYNTRRLGTRLLHHGTLLFSSDMESLAGALKVDRTKMETKGIKSVRSRVCNIKDIEGYCGPEYAEDFAISLCRLLGGDNMISLTDEDIEGIQALSDEKYSKWQWNFGESPAFSTLCKGRFPYGSVEIAYTAKKGKIEKIKISGDFFAVGNIEELESGLVGVSLERRELLEAFGSAGRYIHNAKGSELCSLMLSGIE